MEPEISIPLIKDALTPLTPTGGVVLTYGLQASYLKPGTDWDLSSFTDADALDASRTSTAVWTRRKASLAVQVAEYDSAASAVDGLAALLTKNQLSALTTGATGLGEIAFVPPDILPWTLYFLRANLAVIVSGDGIEGTELENAARAIDDGILQFPQKTVVSTALRMSIASKGSRTFVVRFDPAQPGTGSFYKFLAGGAQLALENTALVAVLLADISDTKFRMFEIDGRNLDLAIATDVRDFDSAAGS